VGQVGRRATCGRVSLAPVTCRPRLKSALGFLPTQILKAHDTEQTLELARLKFSVLPGSTAFAEI